MKTATWEYPFLEGVDGNFEEGAAIRVFRRQFATADIDLQRWNDQLGHGQRLVTRLAQRDELSFRNAVANVDVMRALIGHRGFPLDVAAVRTVVVAHEEPHLAG
jgi:hypothetical protein